MADNVKVDVDVANLVYSLLKNSVMTRIRLRMDKSH